MNVSGTFSLIIEGELRSAGLFSKGEREEGKESEGVELDLSLHSPARATLHSVGPGDGLIRDP